MFEVTALISSFVDRYDRPIFGMLDQAEAEEIYESDPDEYKDPLQKASPF